jgi:Competence protein CoiA-like family/Domain of unknown function (DUF5710)
MYGLGAISSKTGKYVCARFAEKHDNFICPDCHKDVILRKGQIRIPHFAHYNTNSCEYYNNSSESQIHNDAKLVMKYLIENNVKVTITRVCIECSNSIYFWKIPNLSNHCTVTMEYRFEHNGPKVADIAVTLNNKNSIYCIFEICHTHKTSIEDRPEPWFELDAKSVVASINTCTDEIQLKCIRSEKCDECSLKENDKSSSESEPDDDMLVGAILNVPFSQKDVAKSLGARWNNTRKKWFIPERRCKNKQMLWKLFPGTLQCDHCNGTGRYYAGDGIHIECPFCET